MKCCCCFPIECGVKTIGVLTILSTITAGVQIYLEPEWQNLMLPFAIASGLMSLLWIFNWVNDGESSRRITFLGFLCLALVFQMGYYAYLIFNGAIMDKICTHENVDEFNHEVEHAVEEAGDTLPDDYDGITEKDCKYGGFYGLAADFTIKLLMTIYFTYVISKWANHSEGYAKVH